MTGASSTLPLRVQGEVLAVRRAGAYRILTLSAPGVPAAYRPGTFVSISPGGEHLAARQWWIHRVHASSAFGPTIELVVDSQAAAGQWLAGLAISTKVSVTGPLGRPFSMPRSPVSTLLVAHGHCASPLLGLAERLRARDCPVTLLLGADDEQHLLSVLETRRVVSQVVVVTGDGSVGRRGKIADHVVALLDSCSAGVVYTAGPAALVEPVARAAQALDVPCQVGLESSMPCGVGLCQGCVVPVIGTAGNPHQVRACVEGPVLPGDRVRWEDLG